MPCSQYDHITDVGDGLSGGRGETRSAQQRALRLPLGWVCQVLTAVGWFAFINALLWWRPVAIHSQAAFPAGQTLLDEVPSTCGRIQEGVEYWSKFQARWPAPAVSPGHCCALCAGHVSCRAWTWTTDDNHEGGCHLNDVAPGALLGVRRLQGGFSGLVHKSEGHTEPGIGKDDDRDDIVAIIIRDQRASQQKETLEQQRPVEQSQEYLEKSSKELGIEDTQHDEPDLKVSTNQSSLLAVKPAVYSLPAASTDDGKCRRCKSSKGVEWIVVYPVAMNVRAQPDMNSHVISHKVEGAVVVGNRKGDWLALRYEQGFMRISLDGTKYLQQRLVSYVRLESGTCHDIGDSPIYDAEICLRAGILLGYRNAAVANYSGTAYRPEGCFEDGGRLWLANKATMRGHGATVAQKPFCSSMPYPTALLPFAMAGHQKFTSTSTDPDTSGNSSALLPSHASSSTTHSSRHDTETKTSTTLWGPSLFCVVVARLDSTALELIKAQLRAGCGVFNCEESAVFTEGESHVVLGVDRGGRKVLTTAVSETRRLSSSEGAASQQPNRVFMAIWNLVRQDGRFQRHEWTVKVLPSAVFLPSRLRLKLAPHTAVNAPLVVANCNRPEPNQLLEAMQVFSKAALKAYLQKQQDCYWALPWRKLEEAAYMLKCMDQLGVHRLTDYSLAADDQCHAAPCNDDSKVVYTGKADVEDWFACFAISIGNR